MLLSFTNMLYTWSKTACEFAIAACMLLIAFSPINWLFGLHEPHIIHYIVLAAKVFCASFVFAFVAFLANRFIAMFET